DVKKRIFAHFAPPLETKRAGFPASGLPGEACHTMRMLKRAKRPDPGMDRRECEEDAELAAEMASEAAGADSEWAHHAGLAEDDAAEAVRAAVRARLAAERAASAKTDEDARLETASAWAATESALEADQRVVEAIVTAIGNEPATGNERTPGNE